MNNSVKKQKEIKMTKKGYKKLEKELKKRQTKTRKEIAKQLAEAADFGDRSENAAYTQAVEERDANEARIAELQELLANAEIVEKDKGNKDQAVSVGDTVTLKVNRKKHEYEIVGAGEGDISKGKLAIDSPIGEAISGKKKGEKAKVEAPIGTLKLKIVEIS